MNSFPTFIARPLACGAFTLLLALEAATAHAQMVPKPAPAQPSHELPKDIAYFVDGKPTSLEAIQQLKPDDIQAMNVLKGARAHSLGLSSQQQGAILITTKAGANSPEVAAFNQRFPTKAAAPEQQAAIAAAQAYVAQHYPAAKIEFVGLEKGQTDRYNATFTNEGQRLQLLFDGKGNPVER